ncbi:MAG: response regulator [Candidatus Marinimicrobia bacterium]|nr:response regulator [Candidatus Neomarinimicrobiota bacterium]MBL7059903.1 response regulator [Candidatus Neomarinimicrobiota bacterium]
MSKKIMIIDDDIDLVEAMRITLESAGFDVIDAQDGSRGLTILKTEQPDLLILDVMMDSQDEGFQLAYQLRASENTRDIPILMVTAVGAQTGFSFDSSKDESFLPVDEFIEKPVNPQALIDAVKRNLPIV